jgi:hypothetical protein
MTGNSTLMPIYFKWKLLFLFVYISFSVQSQTIWTAGPMIHVNIGKEKTRVSYSLEFAYWNFSRVPYSFDFCIEFERKRVRLYSEAQTGIGIAGISAGPVIEFQADNHATKFGFQSSIWGNYFLGFDARVRFIDKKTLFCPGTYLKVGFAGRDKYGNKTSGSGNDWDWDD